MSRCFPYPPPGFNGKKASDALIDSIKLQKDKEKAETERKKEKRREKKEKRKEKKEKKETAKLKPTETGHGEFLKKDGKKSTEFEGWCTHKRKQEDAEQQLENSGVTEEHGQPLTSQNPSYSSDGTQNSNKRRKQATDSRGHAGNIVRIKLPLQKCKEPEVSVSKDELCSTSGRNLDNKQLDVLASNQQHCSTSGRMELHKEQFPSDFIRKDLLDKIGVGRTSQGDVSSLMRVDNSLPVISSGGSTGSGGCSTSGDKGVLIQDVKKITSAPSAPVSAVLTSRERKMQKKSLKYDDLIQSLHQITLPSVPIHSDDDDWLFGGKCAEGVLEKRSQVHIDVAKQSSVTSNVSCSGSSMLYPRARYLPEVDIYALPYTIPF